MFRIILVCTGNRCRSPIAEACLRGYARGLPLEVGSVGLLDLGAAPPLAEVIEAGRSLGMDLTSHRARPLGAVDISQADLVLGLERRHVSVAVVEGRVPAVKAFTLVEMVGLLERVTPPESDDAVHRARLAVALANHARKSTKGFSGGSSLDLPDPFGGRKSAFTDMAVRVSDLTRRLVDGLFGARPLA